MDFTSTSHLFQALFVIAAVFIFFMGFNSGNRM